MVYFTCYRDSPRIGDKSDYYYSYVWGEIEKNAQPTTIFKDGKNVVDTTLRRSKSVRDSYNIIEKGLFSQHTNISNCSFGLGSKHIYDVEDFMKEHYDTKKEDNHIGTFIVTNDISCMIICGEKLDTKFSNLDPERDPYSYYCVFFTLDCPHEILSVTKKRISFSFPVFGSFRKQKEIASIKTCFTKEDHVISVLEKITGNETVEDIKKICGYLKMFECDNSIYQIVKFFKDNEVVEDYINSLSKFQVSYSVFEGDVEKKINYVASKEVQIPNDAKNVCVKPVNMFMCTMQIIINILQKRKEQQKKYEEKIREKACEIDPNFVCPNFTFYVPLQNSYDSPDIATLSNYDRTIYDYLKKLERKVSFVIHRKPDPKEIVNIGKIEYDNYEDEDYYEENMKKKYYSNIDVEFNDSDGYSPYKEQVMPFFVVYAKEI